MLEPIVGSLVPRSSRIWLAMLQIAAIVLASIAVLGLLAGAVDALGTDSY
jgi:hypothetical protein